MEVQRVKAIRMKLIESAKTALLIHSYENYRYLSGFTGSNAYLLITQDHAVLLTDPRYGQQAFEQAPHFDVIVYEQDRITAIHQQLERLQVERVGIEAEHMSVAFYKELQETITTHRFYRLTDEIAQLRKIKDAKEIALIRQAVHISDQSFTDLLPILRPGMSEREVLAELEYLKMKYGSERPAFGTIVAAGERSALPHATPTDHQLAVNDILLIDYGVTFEGYMSDMTRTIWLGEPSKQLQELYEYVTIALEESIAAIRPGMTGHELDRVARDVFVDAGLEQYSLRGLGHGVGLEIHEKPRLALHSEEVLEENMIVTIEPGLYLPGIGGVRIEDMVVLTKDGCDVLTGTHRHIQLSLIG